MSKSYLLLAMLVLVTFSTNASMKNISNQHIANLSWPEVEAAIKSTAVVIIPLGAAAKEHGPHLPMNNDYLMANYLNDRVLEKIPGALALPTVNYSYYPGFLEYPGSTSLDFDVAKNMIVNICQSLAKQGFNKFYILNTGFSTIKPLQAAKEALATEKISMDYLKPPEFFDSPPIKKQETQKTGSHADEIETSMMLYIAPEIVRMDKAVKDEHPHQGPGGLTRDPTAKTGVYSPSGAWGDPTLATKEKGRVITEAYLGYIIKQINEFISAPDKKL